MTALLFAKSSSMSLLTDSNCFNKEQIGKICVEQSVFEVHSSSLHFFLFVCKLKTKILNHATISFSVI